jgi:superfamily II helicase
MEFKKRFDNPVICSYCKKKQAYGTGHGGGLYGKTICEKCFKKELKKYKKNINKEEYYTEADYQTWQRL